MREPRKIVYPVFTNWSFEEGRLNHRFVSRAIIHQGFDPSRPCEVLISITTQSLISDDEMKAIARSFLILCQNTLVHVNFPGLFTTDDNALTITVEMAD